MNEESLKQWLKQADRDFRDQRSARASTIDSAELRARSHRRRRSRVASSVVAIAMVFAVGSYLRPSSSHSLPDPAKLAKSSTSSAPKHEDATGANEVAALLERSRNLRHQVAAELAAMRSERHRQQSLAHIDDVQLASLVYADHLISIGRQQAGRDELARIQSRPGGHVAALASVRLAQLD